MTDGPDYVQLWDRLVAENAEVEQEIYDELRATAHLFDTTDGTHAKWSPDGVLGMLLVFDHEEADSLLSAFYAGIHGVDEAAEVFSVWVTTLMGLIRQCVEQWSDSQ